MTTPDGLTAPSRTALATTVVTTKQLSRPCHGKSLTLVGELTTSPAHRRSTAAADRLRDGKAERPSLGDTLALDGPVASSTAAQGPSGRRPRAEPTGVWRRPESRPGAAEDRTRRRQVSEAVAGPQPAGFVGPEGRRGRTVCWDGTGSAGPDGSAGPEGVAVRELFSLAVTAVLDQLRREPCSSCSSTCSRAPRRSTDRRRLDGRSAEGHDAQRWGQPCHRRTAWVQFLHATYSSAEAGARP